MSQEHQPPGRHLVSPSTPWMPSWQRQTPAIWLILEVPFYPTTRLMCWLSRPDVPRDCHRPLHTPHTPPSSDPIYYQIISAQCERHPPAEELQPPRSLSLPCIPRTTPPPRGSPVTARDGSQPSRDDHGRRRASHSWKSNSSAEGAVDSVERGFRPSGLARDEMGSGGFGFNVVTAHRGFRRTVGPGRVKTWGKLLAPTWRRLGTRNAAVAVLAWAGTPIRPPATDNHALRRRSLPISGNWVRAGDGSGHAQALDAVSILFLWRRFRCWQRREAKLDSWPSSDNEHQHGS